ncbi:UvrD-helicase domain-containing protein [Flavitalea sp. BT771]|uniref:UvrD-helicase domain-containing protein n=1 Tax=Flavitalea sp. BT771 TaxID=3063329 RepID=UPI0026E2B29F|nr:UvrD-helicase domain-containing protein [Flavitalea sp. BT771]MDO6430899.1 UvrD-helicase domain-containing protein [Flavitalea sp. BT771]MDV6218961.1 UvrD-helicase domain-containing protein [Flavitalea sp. BT771]
MAQTRLILEPEVQEVLQNVDQGRNFLLSGGAGSGKTYSLVQVIKQLFEENPTTKIACITYTNAAVREIEHRVDHSNLIVSTIHDFLWDTIKHFQKELKECLVELANDPDIALINIDDRNDIPEDYFDSFPDGIQYKEYLRLREGIISHDELLVLANRLFNKYPKISSITKDKYKYIFIDEYQDTSKFVIDLLLNHFKKSSKKNILGFFGDAMQSIYEDGIGNLDGYKGTSPDQVVEVKKAQNRRNPQKVIDLANLLRTDGITQVPSTDLNAPNMVGGVVKQGSVKFIYSSNSDFSRIKQHLKDNLGWPVDDPAKTKELNLTHNLIADKAEFRSLMDIYDKDQILAYRNRIKKYIKEQDITDDFSTHSFGEVIEHLKAGKAGAALNPINPTAGMQTFIDAHPVLFQIALAYNYGEFSKLYVDKDQLLDDKKQSEDVESRKGSKRDNLIKHLFKIQNNISLYLNRQFNEFLRVTDFRNRITSVESKRVLKQNIETLTNVGDKTIEEVIQEANDLGICLMDESLDKFKQSKKYIYDQVKEVKFKEFQKLYSYLEGHTPFSTQHKTKGSEFNTVLVILDNGGWNHYNFSNLFLNSGSPSVLSRTQKIFYVCCTRAMENLAVFFHNPGPQVIAKAKEWFGETEVLQL